MPNTPSLPPVAASGEQTPAEPARAPAASPPPRRPGRERFGPLFILCCGLLLIAGATVLYWLEPGGRSAAAERAAAEERALAEAKAAQAVIRAREREAAARVAQERLAAEEAAERTRRAALEADAYAEAQARAQREELAKRRKEAEDAQRAATATEDAWKRFYTPSPNCREPERAATVECVNEYVRAKREFQVRMAAGSS